MRLDKYLKVSRLIKRRTVANEACDAGRVLVNGRNFTEYSAILIDGAAYPTAFVNSAQIVAIVDRSTPVSEVSVAQITADGVELSRTEPFSLE